MPTYEIKGKDGSIYEIDAPDERKAFDAFSKLPLAAPYNKKEAASAQQPSQSKEGIVDQTSRALLGGIPFSDRAMAGMQTLHDYLAGSGKDYAGNLADVREANKQFQQEHPYGSLAGSLVGSAVLPVGAAGAATKGIGLLAKAGYGAAAGAGLGAIQGASESPDLTNPTETAKHVAIGGASGGLLGGTLPLAARGIGQVYSGARGMLSKGPEGISKDAAKHIIPAIEADEISNIRGEAGRLGDQAMLADLGPSLLGKLQGAALNSEKGRTTAQNALTTRNQAANQRIQSDVDRAFGPAEDPWQATRNIENHRSNVDSTNYPNALDNAPPVNTGNLLNTINRMIDRSEGNQRRALEHTREMLTVPGNNGMRVVKDNAHNLHAIKQELDNVIQYDQPGLGVPAGALNRQQGTLKLLRGQLNNILENQVPGYAEANSASSALAKRQEAVQRGTQALDSGKTAMTPERLNHEYNTMEPGERAAFAKGTRGEIDRILDTRANDVVAGKNVIKGEGDWNRDRLATIFGQEPTDSVINSIDREIKFRDTHNKVVENSQTAQRQAAARAMKPEPSSETPMINPNMTLSGLAGTTGKKLVQWIADSIKRDPTDSYGEIARVLTATGYDRDKNLRALVDYMIRKSQMDAQSAAVGRNGAIGLGALTNAASSDQQQRLAGQ